MTTTDGKTDNNKVVEQLVLLTEAIHELARSPRTPEPDRGVLQRQRVDFGFQVLGMLMGRARTDRFNVTVIDARWNTRTKTLELFALPYDATWVELRRGLTIELLEIIRDPDPAPGAGQQTGRRPRRDTPDGSVRPTSFTPSDRIDSLVALRTRQGPPIAIGPRVAPSPTPTSA